MPQILFAEAGVGAATGLNNIFRECEEGLAYDSNNKIFADEFIIY